MATAYMKWLEQNPQSYDRGMRLITLGRLEKLYQQVVRQYVRPGLRVLELGCGTGTLTCAMAEKGALVTGVDVSPRMLGVARDRVEQKDIGDRVNLLLLDVTAIGQQFEPESFDLIVTSLFLSELTPEIRAAVHRTCKDLLCPTGRLIVIDEAVPRPVAARAFFYMIRWIVAALTWLLTRTTTSPLRNFPAQLEHAGFQTRHQASFLVHSLVLYEATPLPTVDTQSATAPAASAPQPTRLHHRVGLRTRLLELWLLFFRIIPPYPRFKPGLYYVGSPNPTSPVLITGNFFLTVHRLVGALEGRVDAWVVVADSAGINVWCGAGGGYFTAERIMAALNSSRVSEVVSHHRLILPQLCANGVDGWQIRTEAGWSVEWGPVRASDIPEYISLGYRKNRAMRTVRFPLGDRLEMVTVTLGFYALLLLLPVLLFWRSLFWPFTFSLLGLSYFYAVVHPWLPGRDGLAKSLPLAVLALAGLGAYHAVFGTLAARSLFSWAIGLTGLSVLTAAEFQGMSPVMRGEQANWTFEAAIGAALLTVYWLVPYIVGWR